MVAAGIGASGSDDVEGNGFADGTGVGELGKNVECGAATAMRLGVGGVAIVSDAFNVNGPAVAPLWICHFYILVPFW